MFGTCVKLFFVASKHKNSLFTRTIPTVWRSFYFLLGHAYNTKTLIFMIHYDNLVYSRWPWLCILPYQKFCCLIWVVKSRVFSKLATIYNGISLVLVWTPVGPKHFRGIVILGRITYLKFGLIQLARCPYFRVAFKRGSTVFGKLPLCWNGTESKLMYCFVYSLYTPKTGGNFCRKISFQWIRDSSVQNL